MASVPDAEGLEYEVIKKRLYLFIRDHKKPGFDVLGDNPAKRQRLWEDMLCSLSREAAVMILNASKKILPDGLSPRICLTAFRDELGGDKVAAQEQPRNPAANATAVRPKSSRPLRTSKPWRRNAIAGYPSLRPKSGHFSHGKTLRPEP
jgi:hypothetical protein